MVFQKLDPEDYGDPMFEVPVAAIRHVHGFGSFPPRDGWMQRYDWLIYFIKLGLESLSTTRHANV
jgi:hypothetical protein